MYSFPLCDSRNTVFIVREYCLASVYDSITADGVAKMLFHVSIDLPNSASVKNKGLWVKTTLKVKFVLKQLMGILCVTLD